MRKFYHAWLCILIYLAGISAANAAAATDIEARTAQLKQCLSMGIVDEAQLEKCMSDGTAFGASGFGQGDQIMQLEAAIRRGEEASGRLRQGIRALEEEKKSLERIQVILTSGLIGALVTAAVAVLGTFMNLGYSRAQRDLRRLEVIEKANTLNREGVPLPEDFRRLLPETREGAHLAGDQG